MDCPLPDPWVQRRPGTKRDRPAYAVERGLRATVPIEAVLVENANPRHPFGARGVGEVPIVPPMAAVANAISVRMRDLPMSPPRLRAAIDAQEPVRRAAE